MSVTGSHSPDVPVSSLSFGKASEKVIFIRTKVGDLPDGVEVADVVVVVAVDVVVVVVVVVVVSDVVVDVVVGVVVASPELVDM